YGLHASNGILFNHESPLRGETFVTRKITRAAAKIALAQQENLFLGNLSAQRDWGHAKDYIKAMWLILQQDEPSDYVIATGVATQVREFVRMAFEVIGINLKFIGQGLDEKGIIDSIDNQRFTQQIGQKCSLKVGQELVAVDKEYFRPTEVEALIGNPAKANNTLGWKPEYDLKALVEEMMLSDIKLMKKEAYLAAGGYQTLNYFE
ncbi:MAG: GDP-mannose 4,6-dehydratase, partial [Mucinivorans sp.]